MTPYKCQFCGSVEHYARPTKAGKILRNCKACQAKRNAVKKFLKKSFCQKCGLEKSRYEFEPHARSCSDCERAERATTDVCKAHNVAQYRAVLKTGHAYRLFKEARKSASKRGIGWSLDLGAWKSLKGKPCHYCDHPVDSSRGGLDRLDNSRGYEPENVVPCCLACNVARNNIWSPDEMQLIGLTIAYLKSKRQTKEAAA